MYNTISNQGFISHQNGPEKLQVNQSVTINGTLGFGTNYTPETLYVTLSGSDTLGNGSFLNPYRSIKKAITVISGNGNSSTTHPYLIDVGTGTFIENSLPLVLPGATAVRGQGQSLTRITTINTGSVIFELGFQTFLFGIVINGNTSYTNRGVSISISNSFSSNLDSSFLVPRIYQSIIANCSEGIAITGISGGILAQNILFNDCVNSLHVENSAKYIEIQNTTFNYSSITGSSAVRFKNVDLPKLDSDIPTMVAGELYFKGCNNAIYSTNVDQTNGISVIFENCTFFNCSTVLNLNDSSNISIHASKTYTTANYEFFQGYPGSRVKFVNSAVDFSKMALQPTGLENFEGSGFDSGDLDDLYMFGPTPSVRLVNNQLNFLSGGAWRIRSDVSGRFSIEQNTNISGTFATFACPIEINNSGSILLSSYLDSNVLSISGSTKLLNQSSLRFLQPGSSSSGNYVELKAPDIVSSSHSYKLPSILPVTSSYLQTDTSGNLRWISGIGGESNTASNVGNGIGLFTSKVLEDLRFKSLVAGSGVTFTSSSTEVTMSISNTGEANTVSNLGSGLGLFAQKSGVDLQFKSLIPGSGIQFSSSSTAIMIATTGSGGDITSGSNLGTGIGLFASKTLGTLDFKSLNTITSSLGSNLLLSGSSTEITLRHKPISQTICLYDDWIGNTSSGHLSWFTTNNGAGSGTSLVTTGVDSSVIKAIGVVQVSAGTATTGRCSLFQSVNAWRLDNLLNSVMEWRVSLPNLSIATIEYACFFGWADTLTTVAQTNGLYFLYDRLNLGVNWQMVASNNGTRTVVNTGVPVTPGTFNKFRIETNLGLTRADYYIDDTLVGSITTSNLPTGTGKVTGIGMGINKTIGNATARVILVDYLEILANISGGGR